MRLKSDTKIHIARDGATLEPRSVAEVRRQLSENKLHSSDLAWCEGLSEWVPVNTLISLADVGGSSDERLLTKDSPFRSAVDGKLRIRPVGAVAQLLSVLNRNIKKERVGSEQLGRGLWAFCKASSRDFHQLFKQQMTAMDMELTETQEYDASQEIVLINLWLISRELAADKKAVMACHQNYIVEQGRVGGMVGTIQDQMRVVEESKAVLIDRCMRFQQMWAERKRGNQMVLASFLLGYILNRGKPHSLASNKVLLAQVNAYLKAMPRTLHELRRRFILVD